MVLKSCYFLVELRAPCVFDDAVGCGKHGEEISLLSIKLMLLILAVRLAYGVRSIVGEKCTADVVVDIILAYVARKVSIFGPNGGPEKRVS